MGPKIVIRAPNHLGDCIMAMPMINETREAYQGATVTLLVAGSFAPLFHGNQAIDNIIELPDDHLHGLVSIMKIKELIGKHSFDLAYILPPSFGAAAGFKLGGVKERIGYISDKRRLLLTKPLPLPAPLNSVHRSELYFDLLRRGATADLVYVKPKLFFSDEENQRVAELMAGFDIPPDEGYMVVAFRSKAESRHWGQENFINLVKRLIGKFKIRVVLIGGPADSTEGDKIAAAAGGINVVNIAGKVNLRETAAILSGALVFIGNDSGPAHLAAASGSPLVVLWGAGDPASTLQLSSQMKMIFRNNLTCISCVKNKCLNKGDDYMKCMKEISVDDVITGVNQLL